MILMKLSMARAHPEAWGRSADRLRGSNSWDRRRWQKEWQVVESLQTPGNQVEIDTETEDNSLHFIVDYYGLTHRVYMKVDHRALQE